MANYIAASRSNYFRVKDNAKFEEWCAEYEIEWSTEDDTEKGRMYTITPDAKDDGGGWNQVGDPFGEKPDFKKELASHLDPRDVALLFEVGAEKESYFIAYAWAIGADGKPVFVDLQEEIEKRARDAFGPDVNITGASD